jgi:hypothetical protein
VLEAIPTPQLVTLNFVPLIVCGDLGYGEHVMQHVALLLRQAQGLSKSQLSLVAYLVLEATQTARIVTLNLVPSIVCGDLLVHGDHVQLLVELVHKFTIVVKSQHKMVVLSAPVLAGKVKIVTLSPVLLIVCGDHGENGVLVR